MPDINLSQSEADALIAMEKVKVDNQNWDYPDGLVRGNIPSVFYRQSIGLSEIQHRCLLFHG